jgi:shikimate kinase
MDIWRGRANIVLIGMPGSGKSTIGVLLAKQLGLGFVDTDVGIQVREGRTLQQILDTRGYLALRAVEQDLLVSLRLARHVIATGGSAAYSDSAMSHLAAMGVVVFLDVPLEQIEARVHDLDTRGIAAPEGMGLRELFEERYPLYRRYAECTIECGGLSQDAIVGRIAETLGFADNVTKIKGTP